jgi:2'-5' RNA ligase
VRLFVAAYPPPAVRDDFARLVEALSVGRPRPPGQSVRLAPADQWHVTLAFLGDVPDGKQDRTVEAVASTATAHPPPTVRIAGGGTFGRGRFTVLWAGLSSAGSASETAGPSSARSDGETRGPSSARSDGETAGPSSAGLGGIADDLRRRLRRARLPYDTKPLHTHVTVARPGDRITAAERASDLAALAAYEGPEWIIDEIRLMRSHLGPKPTYDIVHSAPLIGTTTA